MGEISNDFSNNVNCAEASSKGASRGRCPVGEQRKRSRHSTTARLR